MQYIDGFAPKTHKKQCFKQTSDAYDVNTLCREIMSIYHVKSSVSGSKKL